MKRFSIAIVAAVMLAIAGVTLASADSGTSHKGSGHRIEVFSKTVQFAAIDLGTQGPSLGDEFVFSDDLLTHKGGDKVGIDGGVCTVVRQDAATKSATLQCAVTFSLEHGQIATQALLSMTNGQFTGTQVGPITGGSGRYRKARGEAAIEFLSNDEANITLSVTS